MGNRVMNIDICILTDVCCWCGGGVSRSASKAALASYQALVQNFQAVNARIAALKDRIEGKATAGLVRRR
jgi:hypothetical protein